MFTHSSKLGTHICTSWRFYSKFSIHCYNFAHMTKICAGLDFNFVKIVWLCRAISQSNLNVSPSKVSTSILLAIFSSKKLDWYLSPIVSDFKLKRLPQESTVYRICLCCLLHMTIPNTFPFPLGLISNHPTYCNFRINV